jgi:hypothetical protein
VRFEVGGSNPATCVLEFCRLLGRLKTNYQLSELVSGSMVAGVDQMFGGWRSEPCLVCVQGCTGYWAAQEQVSTKCAGQQDCHPTDQVTQLVIGLELVVWHPAWCVCKVELAAGTSAIQLPAACAGEQDGHPTHQPTQLAVSLDVMVWNPA